MDTFVARQPIFDARQNVYAYELLFRSGIDKVLCDAPDLSRASSKVISDALLLLGFESLTAGKMAFVNVTREVLVQDLVTLLPSDRTVVEILETIRVDDDVVDAVRRLKRERFKVALDDFEDRPEHARLIDAADILKVDCLGTDETYWRHLAEQYGPRGIRLLAERVETREVFETTRKLGYHYFQGYFFARPATLAARDVPAWKASLFRVLKEIHQPDVDFDRMEQAIKLDLGLCWKFLRYINSAYFGWKTEVTSVRRALALLGENETRKWVTLIAMAGMAQDKPVELVVQAASRARLCESLAGPARLEGRATDLFLAGLFSMLDAVLDLPLEEALDAVPLAADVREALLGEPGVLRSALEVAASYERADWDGAVSAASDLHLDDAELPRLYREAVAWTQENFRS